MVNEKIKFVSQKGGKVRKRDCRQSQGYYVKRAGFSLVFKNTSMKIV